LVEHSEIKQNGADLIANADVFDKAGNLILELKGVILKRVFAQFLANNRSQKALPIGGKSLPLSFFTTTWIKRPFKEVSQTDSNSLNLIFLDKQGVGRYLGYTLEKNLGRVIYVEPSSKFSRVEENWYQINLQREQDFLDLFKGLTEQLKKSNPGLLEQTVQVFFLSAFEVHEQKNISTDKLQLDQLTGIYPLLFLAKALPKSSFRKKINLVIATVDSYLATSQDQGQGIGHASLSGFARVLELENKKLKVKRIDFSSREEMSLAMISSRLHSESVNDDQEKELVIRDGQKFVKRIQMLPQLKTEGPSPYKNGGVYLIVGGMGGIGFALALEMARKAKVQLVLVGRSPMDKSKQERMKQLQTLGAQVEYVAVDLCLGHQVQQMIQAIKEKYKKINGIVQSAGILEDRLLISKSKESFQRVIEPKILGTWNLHQATCLEKLDFFMVFSSIVSLTGNFGQSDYAAANSFLDEFVHYRRQSGSPGKTLGINWSIWSDAGMGATQRAINQLKSLGVFPIQAEHAIPVIEECLKSTQTQLVVLSDKWDEVQWQINLKKIIH